MQLHIFSIHIWQTRWDEVTTGRNVHQILPKVSENRAWTAPLLNWVLTGHGPFPDYFHRFRVRPLTRECPFCDTTNPATSKPLLVDCPGTAALRKRYCPKLTVSSVKNYFAT